MSGFRFLFLSVSSAVLEQLDVQFLAFFTVIVWPDARLNFTNVGLAQEEHTQAALTNTAANSEWQGAVDQAFVEVELFAFVLAFKFQLAEQGFLVNTDTH